MRPRRGQQDAGPLLELQPRALWTAFRKESFAFWALCLYVMIEYVRPQQVYPGIDVVPWGQITIALALLGSVFEPSSRRRFFFLDGMLLLYTAIVFASLVVAYDPGWGIAHLVPYINWLLLYYLATVIITSERRLFLFFLTFLLWSLKMSQHGTRILVSRGFGFADWGATGAPGWFENSGEFAIQMCIMLPMSLHMILALRDRWPKWKTLGLLGLLPGTAALSIIASSSRGGQLAGAMALLVVNGQSRRRWRGFILVGVLLPAMWFIIPPEQKERFSSMGEDKTSTVRLDYWRDGLKIMKEHPALGVGYENWYPYYRRYYNPRGQVPHNIFIQAGSELGYTGVAAFVVLIVGTFMANARTRKRAKYVPEWGPFLRTFAFGLDASLVGFLVAGFFVTVLYYPFFWMNYAFTAAVYLITERSARRARAAAAAPRLPYLQSPDQPPAFVSGPVTGVRIIAAPSPTGDLPGRSWLGCSPIRCSSARRAPTALSSPGSLGSAASRSAR